MLTEPGLQADNFPPLFAGVRCTISGAHVWSGRDLLSSRTALPAHLMVSTRRTVFGGVALLTAASVFAACAGPVAAPRMPTPEPPVPVVTVPVVPSVTRYAIPSLVTDTRYRVRSETQLERDSAGRRDVQKLAGSADAVVRLRRTPNGGFQATGRLMAFSMQFALSNAPIALDSLRFEAVLDAQGLRVVMQPPLANECDRAETGALAMVRDVLLRVPGSLTVGETWSDSTVQILCRSSVPLVVRTNSSYVVTGTERGSDGEQLVIRRTSTTRLEGKSTSPWRSVEVIGTGTGTLDARISVLSGAVRRMENATVLTFTVTDRSTPGAVRVQSVVQRVRQTAESG